ncbi:MAG: zf-HC2 domain-containing protein [Candidatus Omnitrophica bacterium]|nr:zf-HC2 domain-containing protein [Candidatus Omnitrophota bacterium]
MNCQKVKSLLIGFLNGELEENIRKRVREHLDLCADCSREKELLSTSWQLMLDHSVPRVSENFTADLMKKIRLGQSEHIKVTFNLPFFRGLFGVRALSGALGFVLAGVFVFFMFWKSPSNNQELAQKIQPDYQISESIANDEEIIKNLDILEDIELLENLSLLTEMQAIENFEEETT